MSESGPERPMSARFPTTRWSRVAAATGRDNPSAGLALEGLCRDYWFPLYAFGRRRGQSSREAEDTVQGFLLAACDHYPAYRRDHDRAAKRGGGLTVVSIDRVDAEDR